VYYRDTPKKRAHLGQTGDGRAAVFETCTGEPVQYVTNAAIAEKTLAGWEETFEIRAMKARASI
jgi:hypothetical protein